MRAFVGVTDLAWATQGFSAIASGETQDFVSQKRRTRSAWQMGWARSAAQRTNPAFPWQGVRSPR